VFLIVACFSAGSLDQKPQRANRAACFLGGRSGFWRGVLCAVFGRGRGRGSLIYPSKHRRTLEPDEQAQARQGGLIWAQALIVPAMERAADPEAYRTGLASDPRPFSRLQCPMSGHGRAAAGRIPRCRRGLDGLLWRDKRVKAGDRYTKGNGRHVAREIVSYRTQLHVFPRARRWRPVRCIAIGLHSLAYNVRCRGAGVSTRLRRLNGGIFRRRDVRQSPGGISRQSGLARAIAYAPGRVIRALHVRVVA